MTQPLNGFFNASFGGRTLLLVLVLRYSYFAIVPTSLRCCSLIFNVALIASPLMLLCCSSFMHRYCVVLHCSIAFPSTFLSLVSLIFLHAPCFIVPSKFDPTSNRLDVLPPLNISCTPYLDGILNTMLCPFMITLFLVMKSTPKTHSTSPKENIIKSTFLLQFIN